MGLKDKLRDLKRGAVAIKGMKNKERLVSLVQGLIPVIGVDAVRKQVIKGIEGDVRRAIKENKDDPQSAVESVIQDIINVPSQVALLKELDMNEALLRVLVQDVLDTEESKGSS